MPHVSRIRIASASAHMQHFQINFNSSRGVFEQQARGFFVAVSRADLHNEPIIAMRETTNPQSSNSPRASTRIELRAHRWQLRSYETRKLLFCISFSDLLQWPKVDQKVIENFDLRRAICENNKAFGFCSRAINESQLPAAARELITFQIWTHHLVAGARARDSSTHDFYGPGAEKYVRVAYDDVDVWEKVN